jgi:hypothetical protein
MNYLFARFSLCMVLQYLPSEMMFQSWKFISKVYAPESTEILMMTVRSEQHSSHIKRFRATHSHKRIFLHVRKNEFLWLEVWMSVESIACMGLFRLHAPQMCRRCYRLLTATQAVMWSNFICIELQITLVKPELNPSAQRCLTRIFYWGFFFLKRAFR